MDFNFEDKDYLPGVYNYCDRWCERCLFNSRCMVYATELEVRENLPDGKKDDDLEYVKAVFENVLGMLKEFVDDEDIDTNADSEKIKDNFNNIQQKVSEQPIIKTSLRYTKDSHEWLKENNDRLTHYFEDLKFKLELNESSEYSLDNLYKIKDTIEIITQYSTFIHVKLFRAYSNEYSENYDEEFKKEDTNVSAKLALIGIERSKFAWEVLKDIIGDVNDSIMILINALRRIEIETEMKFSEAKNYKRPYFDE